MKTAAARRGKLKAKKEHEPRVLRDLRHAAEDASKVRVLRDLMVAGVYIPECTTKGDIDVPVTLLQAIFRHLDRKEAFITGLIADRERAQHGG